MSAEYFNIFTGNLFITQQIITELQQIDIEPIVKDASDSARLAGFAANIDGNREIHVNREEVDKATAIVNQVLADRKA